MHLFRTFFYLALAGNIVLAILSGMDLAGLNAPWHPPGESERLKRQLASDKIVLLQDARPAKPAALATPSAPLSEVPASTDTSICIAFSNLGSEDVDQIKTLTSALGEPVKLQINGVQPASYWVNIPASGGKDGANRRGEILARAGITDFIIVRESGPNQYAISLGLFRSEEAARRLVDQLQKKNIKTAVITTRDNTGKAARTEIRGLASLLTPLKHTVQSRMKTAQSDECRAS